MVIQRLHVIRMTKKPCHFLKQINPIMQVVVATALAAALIRSVEQATLAACWQRATFLLSQQLINWITLEFSVYLLKKDLTHQRRKSFLHFLLVEFEGGPFYFWNLECSIKCIFYCVIIMGFHILHNHVIISLRKALLFNVA